MKLMDQRNRIRKIKKEVSEGNTIIGEWESDGKAVMDGQGLRRLVKAIKGIFHPSPGRAF